MNNVLKYGLLAIGGYLLWNKFGDQFAGIIPGTPAATGTPLQNTVPTTVTTASPIRQLILDKVKANGEASPLSYDQWNWYYAAVRGVPGPSWEDAIGGTHDRSWKMTVDEYLALVAAKGFSGAGSGSRATAWELASKSYVS